MAQNETETFQHFQVLRRPDGSLHELGRGAMGITYKAFDTNLRSHVALKVINAMFLHSDTAKARFLREARAAAGLRHRNVASVYHLGNDDQSFFYAMEFIDGETIAAMIEREGPLPVGKALIITLQVARALGAAHRQHIVHRDIKPANLMACREDDDEDDEGGGAMHVKVIDFGLARSAVEAEGGSSGPITMGGFVGTAQFASPEQLQEQDLDTRSDIYSLGITLWFMLAGRPPFTGSMFSLYSQHMTKEPPWEQLGENVPESVRAVLTKMLEKNPADRYQNPAELRRALETCMAGLSVRHGAYRGDRFAGEMDEGGASGALSSLGGASRGSGGSGSDEEEGGAQEPATPATVGSILGRRYRLVDVVGEGTIGTVYRATDSMRGGKVVAVKVIRAGLEEAPDELARLKEDFAKLRAAAHPHLVAATALGRHGGSHYLVLEWINGFTLVDLLRRRGRLKLRETLLLAQQACGAADHAKASGLERLELAARQVMLHLPAETVAGVGHGADTGINTRIGEPLTDWPSFSVKLNALGISPDIALNVATAGGEMTMVPGARIINRDTQSSIRGLHENSYLHGVAALIYELLNGTPPNASTDAAGGTTGRDVAYVSLGAMNEAANLVLRQALHHEGEGFATCREFFLALARANGMDPQELEAASIVPVEAGGAVDEEVSETLVDAGSLRGGIGASSQTASAARPPTEAPVSRTGSSVAGPAAVRPAAPPAPATRSAAEPVVPALAGMPAHAQPSAGRQSSTPWVAIAAAVVVLIGGIGGYLWWRSNSKPVADQPPPGTNSPAGPTAAPTAAPIILPPGPAQTPVVAATPAPSTGPETIVVPDRYQTLQAAMDAARPGDTVLLMPGVYRGPFTFKEGIRLAGKDISSCVLQPAVNADAAPSVLAIIGCRSGTIENLTIDGEGGPKVDGISIEDSNVRLVNCVVTKIGGNGVTVRETRSRPVLRNLRAVGNGEHGLTFERGAGGSVEDSTFEGNGGCGIIIGDRDSAPVIRNNQCIDNKQHGVNFLRGCRGTLVKNTLNGNTLCGVAITGDSTIPELRENTCRENKQHGLGYNRGSAGVAEDNLLERNGASGILVDGSDTSPTLRNNRSLRNGTNGLTYEKAGGGIAEGNTMDENNGCGVLVSDPFTTPKLLKNTCSNNKQYGIALVNAAKLQFDGNGNKLVGNVLGPVLLGKK